MSRKIQLFIDGQGTTFDVLQDKLGKDGNEVIWVHASSLGEYGIARPIIKLMREKYDCRVLLTFFSSTGVEALKDKDLEYTGADCITYMPLDSKKNVKRFLDIVKPTKVIFIKSEFWLNYLRELEKRNINTYLTSALITEKSVFFRWYGGAFRKSLKTFTKIYTQDDKSVERLQSLGYNKASKKGDSLYDNAVAIAKSDYQDSIIEHFCTTAPKGVFIAGSIDMKYDLSLVAPLVNKHTDTKFIVVPHETREKILNEVRGAFDGKAMLYSECDENTDFSEVQTLIIDFVGALSRIYRYGRWSYVGGGFTPLLHSVIEPSVYGLPVSFGPRIDRKATPQLMMERGIGEVVKDEKDLDEWFVQLKDNRGKLQRIHDEAIKFAKESIGSTDDIVRSIIKDTGDYQLKYA